MPSNLNIQKSDIQLAKSNKEYIKQAAAQVKKDFNSVGLSIEIFSELDTTYDELFDQIYDFIHQLLLENTEKLKTLLYIIDLSEKDLKHAALSHSQQTKAVILSECILEREMQKVLIRNYFSKL